MTENKKMRKTKQKGIVFYLKRDWRLYLLVMLPVICVIVFKYAAYPGLRMAFMDYKPARGYAGSEWVGFGTFRKIFAEIGRAHV